MPFLDRGGWFARAHPYRSYVISARVARKPPEAMLLSAGSPTRSIRSQPAPDGHGELLLIGGEGHPVGSSDAEPARYARLAEFARLHWGTESIEQRWSAQDFKPEAADQHAKALRVPVLHLPDHISWKVQTVGQYAAILREFVQGPFSETVLGAATAPAP